MTELLRELNIGIIQQGSLLDRIDYNIELTQYNVQRAKGELMKVWFFFHRSGQRQIYQRLQSTEHHLQSHHFKHRYGFHSSLEILLFQVIQK